MFHVLIVDDEEPVREAIRILGEWNELGITEISEAADGQSGLRILREKKPDIVLVDMKMPELSGIEFLQIAAAECPTTMYIVISGYDDFQYTRQAIQSRVVDYLLKPVNKTELNRALQKAVDNLQGMARQKKDLKDIHFKLNLSLPSLREKIFLSLLQEDTALAMDDACLKIIGYRSHDLWGVALLRLTNLAGITQMHYDEDGVRLLSSLLAVIQRNSDEGQWLFGFRNPQNQREIVVAIGWTGDRDRLEESAFSRFQNVLQDIEHECGVVGVAAIGAFQTDLHRLADSYRHAESILSRYNLFHPEGRVWLEESPQLSRDNPSILTQSGFVRIALEKGSLCYLQSTVRQYLKKIKDSNFLSLREASRIVDELIIMMGDIALEYGAPSDNSRTSRNSLRLEKIPLDYLTFEDFEALLHSLAEYFYNKITSYIKSGKDFNMYEIKDYIDRNYSEEIKISFFTEKYYLSRVYLMKLFKKEFGFGIYEYVLKVRMDKAKELLGDPGIKIFNISQMLGYNDHNYFSKAFKNYFGLSPTDYRTMILQQNGSG